MTHLELNALLDTAYTIPVIVQTDTFPDQTPYQQLADLGNGFTFTARELLHAVGSKTASLPSNNRDECVNAAFLYAHILDLQGRYIGYKPTIDIDSDLQTNRSNEIGIGVGCLIANKLFNVNWDTLEAIKGQGKRFDYRATNPGQNYVYEFKGTKHRGKQNDQVKNGLVKKSEMHEREESYDIELIVSTHFGFSNQEPRIILADPPFEGFKEEFTEEAENIYQIRHLARIAQFIGDTPLSRLYYLESLELISKREISQIRETGDTFYAQRIREIQPSLLKLELVTQNAQQRAFIGRWVTNWQPNRKKTKRKNFNLPKFTDKGRLEIFQGVVSELYDIMNRNAISELKEKLRFQTQKVYLEDVEYTIFPDGSVMAFRIVED